MNVFYNSHVDFRIRRSNKIVFIPQEIHAAMKL